ncbi:MAG: ATP-NAD kinase [Pyrobaculum sp.]
MCLKEVEVEEEYREWFEKAGITVRKGALVRAVYGRDRDILKALRQEERPVLGVAPPGVDVKLAATDLKMLPALKNCVKIRVPRLTAENTYGRVYAVNEVALLASAPGVFVKYSIYVDGEHLYNDMGDGVLVATPLGSTAYAMSAGGPKIKLEAPVVEIVPVNSALRRPPYVLPLNSTVEIVDAKSVEELMVIGDGVEKARYVSPTQIYVDSFATLILSLKKAARSTEGLPPSALLVKRLLEERGPLTVEEVVRLSGLKPRTARHALQRLRELNMVQAAIDPTNPRRKLYHLT